MDYSIILSVRFNGVCRLLPVGSSSVFSDFAINLISKWPELQVGHFSCICEVGTIKDVCLDSDDDLINLITLCSHLLLRSVNAHLIIKANVNPVSQISSQNYIPQSRKRPIIPSEVIERDDFDGVCAIPITDFSPIIKEIPLLSDNWSSLLSGVIGQEFPGGVDHFRSDLIKHTTKIGFGFRFVRNDRRYVHVKCHNMECPWFIKAKSKSMSSAFIIGDGYFIHNCVGSLLPADNKRLGPKMMGQFVLSNVKNDPSLCGKSVKQSIKSLYGIEIPYWKAQRSAEFAKSQIFGTYHNSYNELRWYCNSILSTNPGSIVDLQTNSETHVFERLFISFKSCLDGFKCCRPMIFIDGTFMKGRAKGTLLSATAKDGNNGLFPIAFAVVSAENNDNWTWFIEKLRDFVRHDKQIFYISDRHLGILHGMKAAFEQPFHFYCLYHLMANLKGRFGKGWNNKGRENLATLFRDAAYAPNIAIFDHRIALFKELGGRRAKDWLNDLSYDKWAFAHSPHITRYGEMTSNAAESFNSWIQNARSLPITNMIDSIRTNICRLYVERRDTSNSWFGLLVFRKENLWNRYLSISSTWDVVLCPSGHYEVRSSPSVSVDLLNRSCSCYQWQIRGFPCVHAVAVISHKREPTYRYVDECFLTSNYIKCYSGDLFPIPETEQFEVSLYPHCNPILPPLLNNRTGRPKKSRNRSYGEHFKKKKTICSLCGKPGRHDLLSCPYQDKENSPSDEVYIPSYDNNTSGETQPSDAASPINTPYPSDGVFGSPSFFHYR